MARNINLTVQRWIYERGNYQIIIDNAWTTTLPVYSQERVTVNGERVRDKIEQNQVLLLWTTVFKDTILDSSGELELKVQWRSGLLTTKSRLLIEGEKQSWNEYYQKKWIGSKGEWPEDSYYEE